MRANPCRRMRASALNPIRSCKRKIHQETDMDFEGIYCFDTAAVRFAIYPDGHDGARIIGQISEETLHDVFGTRDLGDRLLETCKAHFDAIGAAALKRYRNDPNR